MIEKEFVTYEIALALKELGYLQKLLNSRLGSFDERGVLHYRNIIKKDITAPLWQQAEQFLREKFNLFIELYYLPVSKKWGGEVYNLNEDILGHSIDGTSTYEEAREQTILKAIELLTNE